MLWLGTVQRCMPKPPKPGPSDKRRKNYGLSLDRDLMRQVQHLALDSDCFANELIEEALADLLKKYREKKKG